MRRFPLPRTALAVAMAAMLSLPAIARAKPRLLSATPANQATVSKPTRLSLTFSEALVASLSGVELVMTGMPGMANHQPMPITGFRTTVTDKTVLLTLPRPLPAGSYQLRWHAAAADQHRAEGSYTFTVR